jgi:hypothetical protein
MSSRTYAIREVWGSKGAPVLARVTAPTAIAACVTYLRSRGWEARECDDGMIADSEAPPVMAEFLGGGS